MREGGVANFGLPALVAAAGISETLFRKTPLGRIFTHGLGVAAAY
jgi:hypothetical protein